jgi:hypothetical protein
MDWHSWWRKSSGAIADIGKEVLAEEEEGVPFLRNRLVQGLAGISVFAFLVSVLVTFLLVGKTRVPVIIHYNAYFGVDIFGSWWQMYILPFVSLFFFLLNLFLARKFYLLKERIASHILLISAFLVSLFSLIAALAVARANV